MKFFAGIDPGQGGALAVISDDMQEAYAWDYPGSIETASDLLREVMPKLVSASMWPPCTSGVEFGFF